MKMKGGINMDFFLLVEDYEAAKKKLENLYLQLKELGRLHGEAVQQSTENFGHDDGCQEAVDQDRRVVFSQLRYYKKLVDNAIIIEPSLSDVVQMGSIVELSNGEIIKIGGDAIVANHPILTISCNSPLAKAILGKRKGEKVEFRGEVICIKDISTERRL